MVAVVRSRRKMPNIENYSARQTSKRENTRHIPDKKEQDKLLFWLEYVACQHMRTKGIQAYELARSTCTSCDLVVASCAQASTVLVANCAQALSTLMTSNAQSTTTLVVSNAQTSTTLVEGNVQDLKTWRCRPCCRAAFKHCAQASTALVASCAQALSTLVASNAQQRRSWW